MPEHLDVYAFYLLSMIEDFVTFIHSNRFMFMLILAPVEIGCSEKYKSENGKRVLEGFVSF